MECAHPKKKWVLVQKHSFRAKYRSFNIPPAAGNMEKKGVNFRIYTVSATSTATFFVGRSLPGPKRIQFLSPKETKEEIKLAKLWL